jgi:hypothetical protein
MPSDNQAKGIPFAVVTNIPYRKGLYITTLHFLLSHGNQHTLFSLACRLSVLLPLNFETAVKCGDFQDLVAHTVEAYSVSQAFVE